MSEDHHHLTQFGERVRRYRVSRGLTQSQLADEVGLDRKTVNRLESGQYSTSLRNVFRIATALGVLPARLFDSDQAAEDDPLQSAS